MSNQIYAGDEISNQIYAGDEIQESNAPPPPDSGVEEVRRWLRDLEIEYDEDKFVEKIKSPRKLSLLKSEKRIKRFFPGIGDLDCCTILDAVQELTSSPKPPQTPTSKEEKIRAMLEGAKLRPVDSKLNETGKSVKEMNHAILGEGSFAKVFRVQDSLTGDYCAVKVMDVKMLQGQGRWRETGWREVANTTFTREAYFFFFKFDFLSQQDDTICVTFCCISDLRIVFVIVVETVFVMCDAFI